MRVSPTWLLVFVLALATLSGCLINNRLFNERLGELPAECGDEDYTPPFVGQDPCVPTPTPPTS